MRRQLLRIQASTNLTHKLTEKALAKMRAGQQPAAHLCRQRVRRRLELLAPDAVAGEPQPPLQQRVTWAHAGHSRVAAASLVTASAAGAITAAASAAAAAAKATGAGSTKAEAAAAAPAAAESIAAATAAAKSVAAACAKAAASGSREGAAMCSRLRAAAHLLPDRVAGRDRVEGLQVQA